MSVIGSRRIPDPLITIDHEKIQTAEQWLKKRRPEIIELFQEHVYGKPSIKRPDSLQFEIVSTNNVLGGKATRKKIDIKYEGPGGKSSFRLLLFIPNHVRKPVPTFLFMNKRSHERFNPEVEINTEYWPVPYLIERGYATAQFQVFEIAPDDSKKPYLNSVHSIFDQYYDSRPDHLWGTIAAWAWGASRAMDYLEKDPEIDSKLVSIVGHSRGGKAVLWAGASDERFNFVISNDSGCTGAAISRGKTGETIEKINTSFPHWFNGNYKKYNGKEESLPVDQHMLIASIAPRPIYVASSSNDLWADPKSEFLSLIHAEPVYRLFGFKGLEMKEFPESDTPIYGNYMGYHVTEGDHGLTKYDWKNFINFWEVTRESEKK